MTKRVARHGGAPAPYTKDKKIPYTYNQTPLHKEGKGVAVTTENVRKFEERLGIKRHFQPRETIY